MGVELIDKPAPEISPQWEVLHMGGILSGVLQGSMLGPLLYNILKMTLMKWSPKYVDIIKKFADDTLFNRK